jgi:hypothetical protein
MPTKKNKSFSSLLIFIIIQILIIFFLVEAILSIVYYHKYGNDSLATIQFYKKIKKNILGNPDSTYSSVNQKLVRRDSSLAMNVEFNEEVKESNITVFDPWMQFKNADFKGKYININGPLRKTSPDIYNNTSKDTVTIYFFGGSTQFGFNVTDAETIPSQFVNVYRDQFPNGKCLKVCNFGMPFYYSYQELTLMSQLFFNGHKPSLVIFLDGLNDFWFVKASYYKQPFFSYILRQVFEKEYLKENKFHFKDTSELMIKDPKEISRENLCKTLVQYYFENINNEYKIASLYNSKAYFFCQPVPFYHYPNQDKDPICDKDKNTRFDIIYPMIEQQGLGIKNFTFLGNMLQTEYGYPFADGYHYSPQMNKKIAVQIFNTVKKDLE